MLSLKYPLDFNIILFCQQNKHLSGLVAGALNSLPVESTLQRILACHSKLLCNCFYSNHVGVN